MTGKRHTPGEEGPGGGCTWSAHGSPPALRAAESRGSATAPHPPAHWRARAEVWSGDWQGSGLEAALPAVGSWDISISHLGTEAWGQASVHTPTMGISPGRPLRWELPGGTCSRNTSQASYQPARCLISPLEALLRVVTEISDTRVTCCNRPPGSSREPDARSEAEETVLQVQLGVWEPPQHADAPGRRCSLF